jgi:magnesium-transporting ATPase (P-type)
MRSHKQSGGYKYLYAKRKLNCDETAKAREDLQNLYCQLVLDEKVYIETLGKLEEGLTFVGILNMKDILREGAKEFISNCKLGNIKVCSFFFFNVKVNMLSGDDKNKCLTVAKQVEMIEQGTGYTELHFKDEDDGVAQFRRVFKDIEKFNKSEACQKKKEEETALVHHFIESINQEAEKEVPEEAPAQTNFEIKVFPVETLSYPHAAEEKIACEKSRKQSLVITKKNIFDKNSPS